MWCVEGQYQIYVDARMLNDHQKMAHIITEERRILTGSLHTLSTIEELFKKHKCEWMERSRGRYNEEITREFYASYTTSP